MPALGPVPATLQGSELAHGLGVLLLPSSHRPALPWRTRLPRCLRIRLSAGAGALAPAFIQGLGPQLCRWGLVCQEEPQRACAPATPRFSLAGLGSPVVLPSARMSV